ncbi:P1 family peptidase [Mycobacterium sp. ITM-2016-00318]|uniref:P1 family peptidase n=1 Tax=Mycobacterium sp. ITM-2016-00318 TaxID=2099693 RepID=UPI0021052D2D|nr:P1 family peptidase [Mycobacterium sp. ITM-2016-00318]WNG90897.1 P1 family peptidase [Mycobacterium sp. ITM-2016-00318]
MAATGVRETWDGYLNDINGGHVRPEHVEAALDAAGPGPVAEGSVGGGTGMKCYEYKVGSGTTGSHFSGDIFLAFSTADAPRLASAFPIGPVAADEFGTISFIPWGRMDDLYTAVVQSVEEAVLNALVVNDDMVGRDGHRSPRLPHDRLVALLDERHNR